MKSQFIWFAKVVLCAIMIIACCRPSNADPRVKLSVHHGLYRGSECILDSTERQHAFMIGMIGTIAVIIDYPESMIRPYNGVQDWDYPQGLTIEANIVDDTNAAVFSPSESVLKQLHLTYYVERHQAMTDSLWRSGIVTKIQEFRVRPVIFWFHADLADEWAGKYLALRAQYESQTFGSLISPVAFFKISRPCSKADSNLIQIANIESLGDARHYDRVFALMDSLLSVGWYSRRSLGAVGIFAAESKHYDRWLHYLEKEYQHYGNIGASHGEEITPVSSTTQAEYDKARRNILEQQAEYQKQQHH